MSFFSRLFGQRAAQASARVATGDSSGGQSRKTFCENDNLGTRHDSVGKAVGYWMVERRSKPHKDPFVLYTFDTERAAREALLELPCIHLAQDTSNLICTQTLIFGCYQTDAGQYEAILCGDELSYDLWEQARSSFAKHGGTPKKEQAPERHATPSAKAETGRSDDVVFVREEQKQTRAPSGAMYTMTYRIYKGPSAAAAKAFLQQMRVTENFRYIVVETPVGNWARDVQGIYKEE